MKPSPEDSLLSVRGLPVGLRGLRPLIARAVGLVLKRHGIAAYAVSVTLVDDRKMTDLNRRALGRQGTTDVIAFDLAEDGLVHDAVADIYVSLEQARRQSRDYGVSLREEILRLVLHGLLHTIGYGDRTASQRRKMESCVERSLKAIVGSRACPGARGDR